MHLRNSADKVVSHKKFKADPELLKLAEQQTPTQIVVKSLPAKSVVGTNGTGFLIESTGSTKPLLIPIVSSNFSRHVDSIAAQREYPELKTAIGITPRLRRWKHQPQPLQQKRLKSHLLAKFAGSPHTRAWV